MWHERSYGVFKPQQIERSKDLPVIKWDCQMVEVRKVIDLDETIIENYKLISQLEDAYDHCVTISLVFHTQELDEDGA